MFGYDEAPAYDTVEFYDGWNTVSFSTRDKYKEVTLVTTSGTRAYYEHENTGILTRDVEAFEKHMYKEDAR